MLNQGVTVNDFKSHLHFSLLPQYGQLQSQYNKACLQDMHLVYSAKSSFNRLSSHDV